MHKLGGWKWRCSNWRSECGHMDMMLMANRMETMSMNQYYCHITSFVVSKMVLHQPLCLFTAHTNQLFQIQQHYRNCLIMCFGECFQYRNIFQIEAFCHNYTHILYPVQIIFFQKIENGQFGFCVQYRFTGAMQCKIKFSQQFLVQTVNAKLH